MRLLVVAFLEPQALDEEFDEGDLPLHVTLVPPATTQADTGELEAAIEGALSAFGPLEAEGGDDDLFGEERDVEVTLVEDTGELSRLHRELLLALRPVGIRAPDPEHFGAGYQPHVTVREDGRIERGERIELDAVALLTRESGEPWRLVAQFPLI